jgi:uncharacterized domain 1
MTDNSNWREIMGDDAYALKTTGIEVVEVRPGYAKTRLPVTPAIMNGHGNVHGGAYFTLADYTAALASNMLGTPTIATNGSISFLRAVQDGELVAEAKTVKSGKRMNFMMVEIFDAAGVLSALFQGSSISVPKSRA